MTGVAYLQQDFLHGLEPQQSSSAMQKHFAAEQKSLLGHLRMVADIARNYETGGVQPAELVRAGNLGLIHALEHYEPGNSEYFSGYAARCIRQHIERFLATRQQRHQAAEQMAHYDVSPSQQHKSIAAKQAGNQSIYVVRTYIESRIGELRRSVHASIRPEFGALYD